MKIFFILWKQHYFCLMMCGLFVIFCFKFTCLPLLVKNFWPLEFVLNPPTDTLFLALPKRACPYWFPPNPPCTLSFIFLCPLKNPQSSIPNCIHSKPSYPHFICFTSTLVFTDNQNQWFCYFCWVMTIITGTEGVYSLALLSLIDLTISHVRPGVQARCSEALVWELINIKIDVKQLINKF